MLCLLKHKASRHTDYTTFVFTLINIKTVSKQVLVIHFNYHNMKALWWGLRTGLDLTAHSMLTSMLYVCVCAFGVCVKLF